MSTKKPNPVPNKPNANFLGILGSKERLRINNQIIDTMGAKIKIDTELTD